MGTTTSSSSFYYYYYTSSLKKGHSWAVSTLTSNSFPLSFFGRSPFSFY